MNDSVQTTPQERLDALADNLRAQFEQRGCEISTALGEITMVVPREQLIEIATQLHDDELFQFKLLIDICGVDYAGYGSSQWVTKEASATGFGRGVDESECEASESGSDRFAVVYHLLSVTLNHRLRLRTFVETEHPIVDSVIGVWNSSDWFEREAFDMYGILFKGHPDLRRILTDYGFVGHPLRKDFPLSGHVEMRYDPEQRRVIYQPVTIPARTQMPRVIREDHRPLAEEESANV
ncbi:MAG: NADH-quinone oxidoreductase subunit C [Gammaproteobacteria bacterium]|nr:NADH-quinone oxidoreductase subunit C [Gammaproteobacteria bacterium]